MNKDEKPEMYKKIYKEKLDGYSYGQLANKYGKCRASIQRIIKSMSRPKKKAGRKPILDKWDRYHIKTEYEICERLNIPVTSNRIKHRLHLKASKSTVCRTLKSLNLVYERLFSKYKLTKKAKQERVRIARSYIENQINWDKVVFSDEKLFTLVGNDSYYTWKRKGLRYFRTIKFLKYPGVMVWASLFRNGTLSFRILTGSINSSKYINVLKDSLIPMAKLNMPKRYLFQHDNCTVHTSSQTNAFLNSANIEVIPWAPYSPDLNIIENVWSDLSNKVYSEGNIKNLKELTKKIKQAIKTFNETNKIYVDNLYLSIPRRLCDIIEKHGNRI